MRALTNGSRRQPATLTTLWKRTAAFETLEQRTFLSASPAQIQSTGRDDLSTTDNSAEETIAIGSDRAEAVGVDQSITVGSNATENVGGNRR